MKKLISFLFSLGVIALFCQGSLAYAAEGSATCVLMKFTDDTRFDRIESNAVLSDLLLEKLLNSGKFNFKETKVIDENMERMLYEERAAEFQNARAAISAGDFNVLFEGPGYSERWAQNISTASLGQIVSPQITSAIGAQHQADYLIQGTIVNIGTGNWLNEDTMKIAQYAQYAMTAAGAARAMSALGPAGALLGGFSTKETGIGVQADVRVIKADTGEVVWKKRVLGKDIQKQHSLMGGMVKIGTTKLSANIYGKAMDKVADKIMEELIADMNEGKLFLK